MPVCILCGKSGEVYKHLCIECYRKKYVSYHLPRYINISVCSDCGAARIGERWSDVKIVEKAIFMQVERELEQSKEVEERRLNMELEQKDTWNWNVTVRVDIKVGDFNISEELKSKVRIKRGTCQRCSKKHGSYFEAILQVRGSSRELTVEELDEIKEFVGNLMERTEKMDREFFVGRVEEVDGGIDFYLSSRTAGRNLAKELMEMVGGEMSEAAKLHGMKKGKELYRMTYLLRLPPYKEGDFIYFKKKSYRVLGFGKKTVTLLDLSSLRKEIHDRQKLQGVEVIGGGEVLKEAVVLFQSANEIQIMDPETYKVVELKKPKNFSVGKGEVKVLKVHGELFLVPEK